MPLSTEQKTSIEEVIEVITSTKDKRGRREISEMFLEMVDKNFLPEYYEVSFGIHIDHIESNRNLTDYPSAEMH